MYDYGFLSIKEYPEGSYGYGMFYTGLCKSCGKKWSTASMDLAHGTSNLKHMFRKHARPHSNEPCSAGVPTYSMEYERYRLKIRTPQNEPASRYSHDRTLPAKS
jgi:hypothetical protein